MHSPRPYGLLVLGEQPTQSDESFIESFVRSLTNIKSTSNLDSLRLVRTLPDGGYVIVQDMGGTLRIIVHKQDFHDPLFNHNGLTHGYVPMLFCGAITKSIPYKDDGVGIKLTEITRRRLSNYESLTVPKNIELQRFKIEYAEMFKYFEPQFKGVYTQTQYVKHRPTWYSGAIAEVLQIVGGYGRLHLNELPDDRIERAQFTIPSKYFEDAYHEIENYRLPAYSGIPNTEGQFNYDYKATLCNGVAFDEENNPWLLKISASGVYVMPLPLIPITTTKAFRRYIEDHSDSEILKILERFGGMPSGETFPSIGFDSWVRAGAIIKVCDTSDFYEKQSIYAACGWSFNSRGSEAFNTCWNYQEDGLKIAYAYKLSLKLKAAKNRGCVGIVKVSVENSATIGKYIEAVNKHLIDGDSKSLAIRYKLRMIDEDILVERANIALSSQGVTTDEIDYLDSLELKPIASHSGNIALIGSGPIYWPGKVPTTNGRLKFPELTGLGCESFDLTSPSYTGEMVLCDTILFGSYINDQLKVIKYFFDQRTFKKNEESSYEEIMIVGQWEKTTITGSSSIVGNLYSSDFDDRAIQSDTTEFTSIKGIDLGYGNPSYYTPSLFNRVGVVSRDRHYKHETIKKITSGSSFDLAFCIPVFERDAVIYSYLNTPGTERFSEVHTQQSIPDPTWYEFWTHDTIYHSYGSTYSGNKGAAYPSGGYPVYMDTMRKTETVFSDFAESGNWYGFPVGAYLDISNLCSPYTTNGIVTSSPGGFHFGGEGPKIKPYSVSYEFKESITGRIQISKQFDGVSLVSNRVPDPWYFAYSPQITGVSLDFFYRDSCRVVFGESKYANISEKSGERRKYWGHSTLVDHSVAYHFIGVINE